MLIGIGVDVLHLPRMAALLRIRMQGMVVSGVESEGGARLARLARHVMTPGEQRDLEAFLQQQSRGPGELEEKKNFEDLVRFVGARWAIKEAAYKAFFPAARLRWKDIGVTKIDGVKPSIEIQPQFQEKANSIGLGACHVTLSHDGEYVVAMVVAETK